MKVTILRQCLMNVRKAKAVVELLVKLGLTVEESDRRPGFVLVERRR